MLLPYFWLLQSRLTSDRGRLPILVSCATVGDTNGPFGPVFSAFPTQMYDNGPNFWGHLASFPISQLVWEQRADPNC